MPTDQTMGIAINDVLKGEAPDRYSRDAVVVLAGQSLAVGQVLGKVTAGTVPTTGTAGGANTGNGTMTVVTGGVDIRVGVYTLTCVTTVLNGGEFTVQDPDGMALPDAIIGTAYTNSQLNFTINDGAIDYDVNDTFTVTVAAGGLQVRAINFSGVDGSAHVMGISFDAYDASASGEYTRTFTSGGTYEINAGDTITGAISGQTARVIAVSISGGAWSTGDAAGTLTLDTVSGAFQAENLNVGGNLNVATIAGVLSATAATDINGTAIVRQAQITSTNLAWPTGTTNAQKAAALVELAAKGIITRVQG